MASYTFQELIDAGYLAIGDGYRAKANELGGRGPIFLRAVFLQDQGFDINEPERFIEVDVSYFGQKLSKLGDAVITTKGNSTGRVGYIRSNGVGAIYSPHLSYWRSLDHHQIHSRYLYYWSRSSEFHQQLAARAYSTDMAPYLSLGDQLSLSITLPDIQSQTVIARILGNLDDKIELNRRMNETLEVMARALFKSWFVDFDPVHAKAEGRQPAHMDAETAALFPDSFDDEGQPKGWKMGTLGDLADSPRRGVKPDEVPEDTPYIGLEHMPRRSIALADWEDAGKVTSTKSRFEAGEFLFGKLRPYFHKVGVAPLDGICSTDIVVVRSRSEIWRSLVIACLSTKEFVDYTDQNSSGTKMPRTNWKDMARYEISNPTDHVVRKFDQIVWPMIEKIIANIHENRTLSKLRDTLLPKLMSGEARVRDVEKEVEVVL